eukprot:scaffold25164_cov96-Isochrysis_galbana.AAC.2
MLGLADRKGQSARALQCVWARMVRLKRRLPHPSAELGFGGPRYSTRGLTRDVPFLDRTPLTSSYATVVPLYVPDSPCTPPPP